MFYTSGGINGSLLGSNVTELVPVDYSKSQAYMKDNPFHIIDRNSSSNIFNKMCTSGTCDIGGLGAGLSLEARMKLRPFSFLEFDL